MEERKNFWDKNVGRYDRFMRKDAAAYAKTYELIRHAVRHKTVPEPEEALRQIRRVLKDDGILIAPTFTYADNSFSGKIRAYFMKGKDQSVFYEACRLFLAQQVVKRRVSSLFRGKRLGSAKKRGAEGVVSADLRRVCKIRGINHANI